MKKKTFFTTQFMFLLFFNGAVLLLSVMLWKEKLEVQKEMALSEHYMILSSVMRDMQAEGGDGYDAAKLMEPYTRYRKDKRRALFLYRGEQLLYSDVDDWEIFDMEKTAAAEEGMRRIRTDGLFLYVEGKFPQPWDDYILVYRYDLRQMYENWRKLKNTLFLGGKRLFPSFVPVPSHPAEPAVCAFAADCRNIPQYSFRRPAGETAGKGKG